MAQKKGRTAWEILMDKLGFGEPAPLPAWQRICNPLDAQVGQFLEFDLLDLRGKNFEIKEVTELAVQRDGRTFKMCELFCKAGEEQVWLRLIPTSTGMTAIVLQPLYSFGNDTDDGRAVDGCVHDPAGNFKIDNNERNIHEEYFRVDDVKTSYVAKTLTVNSSDAEADPVVGEREYWDYWRKTVVEEAETVQYLYVEQTTSNLWWDITRGEEIDPARVTKY